MLITTVPSGATIDQIQAFARASMESADGLLLSGGNDISSIFYNKEPQNDGSCSFAERKAT